MIYILLIFLIICIYLLLQNRHLIKNREILKSDNEFLQSLRNDWNRYGKEERLNRERINNSKVLFNTINVNGTLVIKDELDFQYKGITVYIANSAVDIPCTEKLQEIATIDLYKESDSRVKIERLNVNKEYRRKKIASLLIKRVMEWAKLRNISELYLFPSGSIFDISHEDLVKFYLQNGFEYEDDNYMKAKIR